ncbi:hypothetical protein BV898_03453 [Hypsibius exemplaris]|uniref:Uncharacterized protein n=1 Tax=Hypsibius exemplaris TaxID=2072580 RepID=A0A1W0X5E8_HYPEX|nr:hypothetical protein BV898_03453 [Hypsibius exemplaris]
MESLLVLAFCFLGTIVSAQQWNGGFPGMGGPQPLPLPGFDGGPGAMNPFLGPQQLQGRQMPMKGGNQQLNERRSNINNDGHNGKQANHNDNHRNEQQQGQQSRSGSDSMLDRMGLGGIAPFYQSLTNELSKTPTGMGMGGGEAQMPQGMQGMQGNY